MLKRVKIKSNQTSQIKAIKRNYRAASSLRRILAAAGFDLAKFRSKLECVKPKSTQTSQIKSNQTREITGQRRPSGGSWRGRVRLGKFVEQSGVRQNQIESSKPSCIKYICYLLIYHLSLDKGDYRAASSLRRSLPALGFDLAKLRRKLDCASTGSTTEPARIL